MGNMPSEEYRPHTENRLALLYRLSQTFNSSLDLNEVLNRVIDEIIEILHAERGFVMLFGPDGSQTFSVARGLDRKTIDDPQSQVSQSVIRKVASEGKPILTSDAQADERFNMRESIMLLGLRSILCVPLKVKDEVRGMVYADNRFEAGIFTQADLDLLSAIASIAAIAIENARLYQMAVEKGRMERELQLAREMQSSFLPQEVLQVPGWDFAARWQPAREVAGDYYDFIPLGDDKYGLVIADVADKGAPAAMFMIFSNSIVRASVRADVEPVISLQSANRLICDKSPNAMFVSLVYAMMDTNSGRLTYVNAGHNPPLYYNSDQKQIERLAPTGMVLGIDPDTAYTQKSLVLQPGDFILFYTDGLIDAINSQNIEFGMDLLERITAENQNASAEEIVSFLEYALFDHLGGITPFDDVTLLVVKRL
jgi:phosphoserine phosphatase RsbU/P